MFKFDYHIHTNYSVDSDADMEEMVLSAISKGLDEIALTDHVDYHEQYEPPHYNDLINKFNIMKEKYSSKINMILGVEVGLENQLADTINEFMDSYNFDFIIGSSHGVCRKDLYFDNFFEGMDKKTAYTLYFTEMLKNINTISKFCVYGHLDFISRYGTYDDKTLLYKDYSDIIDEILKTLISKNKGIEINTSGYRYKLNQTYPQFDILKRYKELGGEIVTIGSDAHTPDYVADHFEVAYDMLDRAGFKYTSRFKNLKPIFTPLN